MARVAPTQQNFTSGELSQKLLGHYDLTAYANGAAKMQNFIVAAQGPAIYRSGTRLAWNTRDSAAARLVPFEFNTSQAYVLEFSNLKMRIFKDGGVVTNTPTAITAITKANPAVVTSTAHGLNNGEKVVIVDVGGMAEVNNLEFTVANKTANTFELSGINSTNYTTYTSGGTVAEIVEVTSPYTEAQLFEVNYAQTADTMYLVHPSHAPYKLTRSSHTAWTLATYVRTADPFTGAGEYPSVVAFFEQRLIMASSDNAPQKIWGSVGGSYDDFTTGTADDDAFVYVIANGQVNRIRWMQGTEEFLAVGTAGTEFRASGGGDMNAITPTNITIKPASYYGSANVKPILLDTHIIFVEKDSKTIRSFEYDALQDGYSSINRTLLADHVTGTGVKQVAYQAGQPSVAWFVRNDGQLAGFTFEPKEEVQGWHRHVTDGTFESVATIPQANAPDAVYFVIKRTVDGVTKRFVEYFSEQPTVPIFEDYYTGVQDDDLSSFNDDLWEIQKELFFVDCGVTYDGSAYATYGLTLSAVTGNITVTAGGSTFTSDMVGNQIWAAGVGRMEITAYTSATVVSATVLEDFPSTALAAGAWYLTASTFGGLQHLAGEDVVATADGGVEEGLTVTAQGTVTIGYECSFVNLGLPYRGIIKTMPLEGGGNNGPAATKNKSISRVGVRFLNTLGAQVGSSIYDLTEIAFRDAADVFDRPPPLFSGIKDVHISDNWDADKSIFIVQDAPLPCIVTVLQPHFSANDG
jgi:hypothetical protein